MFERAGYVGSNQSKRENHRSIVCDQIQESINYNVVWRFYELFIQIFLVSITRQSYEVCWIKPVISMTLSMALRFCLAGGYKISASDRRYGFPSLFPLLSGSNS